MVEREASQQGHQRHRLAHPGDGSARQHLLVVVDVVAGDADRAERGGGEAADQVDVGPEIALGIGGGVVLVGGDAGLQGVERPREIGQRQGGVEALQYGPELGVEGQGVGASEQVVERQHRVGGDAFAGGVAAAQRQAGARPVGQGHDHGPQPFCVRRRGEGHVDGVVDAGVEQPPLQLGHVLGIVDLARAPGREAGHPARVGAALGLQLQPVQLHDGLGVDVEGGAQGVV